MKTDKYILLLQDALISKALIKLGVPTMVGMMVSSLYNLVDTFFVGMLGTSQQAAVSAVFPLSLLMLGVGLLYGSGAGSYLSRLLGQGEKQKADDCASTALFLATITGMFLVVIMLIGIEPLLLMLGCTKTMLPYARQYGITFLTVGFQLVYSMKFMGMGSAMNGGLISLGRQGFFFIPAVYILSAFFGLDGLILAQPAADVMSMILVSVLAYRNHKAETLLIGEPGEPLCE